MKTAKTTLFAALFISIFALGSASCTKDKDNDLDRDNLIGVWTMQQSEITIDIPEGDDITVTRDYTTDAEKSQITFSSDGKILVRDWDKDSETYNEERGTYRIVDGKIHADVDGNDLFLDKGLDYTLNGNSLVITGTDDFFLEELDINTNISIRVSLKK